MLRVLHILDDTSGFQSARAAQQLRQGLGGGFDVASHTLAPPGRWRGVFNGVLALRRNQAYDIVHAFGPKALMVAALASSAPLIYSPPPQATPRTARWLRAILQHRPVHIVGTTATQRLMLIARGVPPDDCHLIRPGVEFARVRPRRDARLRLALGFADEDIVLLAAGESDPAAGHRDAAWAASILHTLDPRWRLLLWGRGREAQRVREFGIQLGTPREICIAEQRLGRALEYEDLLPATDMVLATATGPVATLPIAIAMAAALPIIATATPSLCELLEDRHTALLVSDKALPSVIARKVLELHEDKSLQWRLADMARTEAYEYFSGTRFLEQWRSLYRQAAAGGKVDVPEISPGVGSRFAGRA